ncbi:septal ring lytic transglycosylase RlpA family protein [Maritalea porphyrae]|uniref:septal ring lytic transglycosylase RlpA family protein n=1 Tax=Maritalea porphyrae TaxID=880732 RepID=UPI0024E0F9CB|nr:septal ring lytic transglycosylase RlpA family protein [Maritalea porphyrae]
MYVPMIFKNLKRNARLAILLGLALPTLAACGGTDALFNNPLVNNKTKFSSSEYGVAASPRLTSGARVKKGGGRYQVGKPYKVAGKWYHPKEQPNYDKTGTASWYGPNFHGRLTANGEIYDQNMLSAAHPTLPLPSYVRVTNLSNGRSALVRVNDRGPFAHGRLIDLSSKTADVLQFKQQGTAKVRVQYVGKAPLNGDDTRFLLASINKPTDMERGRIQLAFAGSKLASMSLEQLQTTAAAPTPPTRTVMTEMPGFDSDAFDLLVSSYTQTGAEPVNAAHAAIENMGSTSVELDAWREHKERGFLSVNRSVGVFSSDEAAHRVGQELALLGIVDLRPTTVAGKPATQVFLEKLRPGVSNQDVNDLAQHLGLSDFVL